MRTIQGSGPVAVEPESGVDPFDGAAVDGLREKSGHAAVHRREEIGVGEPDEVVGKDRSQLGG